MADTIPPELRSKVMARIRGKDTAPELAVRRFLFRMGFRYRLHRRDLPGCPDLVFPGRRAVIFVHGCFWHSHPGCPDNRIPKSRVEWWTAKLARNKARDAEVRSLLEGAGWQVVVIWECEVGKPEKLAALVEWLKAIPSSRPCRPAPDARRLPD